MLQVSSAIPAHIPAFKKLGVRRSRYRAATPPKNAANATNGHARRKAAGNIHAGPELNCKSYVPAAA